MNFFKRKEDASLRASVPQNKTLYGVEIRKVPIGKYLDIIEKNENLPAVLLEKLFPGKGLQDIIDFFITVNTEDLSALLSKSLMVLPGELLHLLSDLYGIEERRLFDIDCENPLTPYELTEIIKAFWELNDMTGFFKTVLSLIPAPTARETGSSGFSPSESASE